MSTSSTPACCRLVRAPMAAAPAPPGASQRGRSPRARSGGRLPAAAGSASASALRRWRQGARGAPRTILRPARRAPLRGGLRGAGGAAASGRVMSAAAPRRDRGGHGQWRGGAGAAARRQPMGGGMRRSGRRAQGPGGRGVGRRLLAPLRVPGGARPAQFVPMVPQTRGSPAVMVRTPQRGARRGGPGTISPPGGASTPKCSPTPSPRGDQCW